MRSFPLWVSLLLGCLCPGVVWAGDESTPPTGKRPPTQVETLLAGREVRVGDLAKLAPGDVAANLVAARLPAGGTTTLSAEQRRTLLRRRIPGRDLPLRDAGPVRFSAQGERRETATTCFALNAPLEQGEYLDRGHAAVVPCQASLRPSLRHDPRAGAPFAAASLAAGTYLGRVALSREPAIRAGTPTRLVAAAGPVIVERQVHTLQPARAGQHVFAIDEGGAVVEARLVTEAMP